MKATPQLIALTAAYGITLTAESTESDVTAALETITATKAKDDEEAKKKKDKEKEDAEKDKTTAALTPLITAAVKPLEEKITAQAAEIQHLKGLSDHGLGGNPGSPTAAAPAPVPAGKTTPEESGTPRGKAITAFAQMSVFAPKTPQQAA